jgi:DNA-binding HxlR family transcriptional regulator
MAALDLLGRRSTLRILWELREGQPLTFRALQDAAETNPSLLNTRLRDLREAGLLSHEGEGYELTPSGKSLLVALKPLLQWSKEWSAGT